MGVLSSTVGMPAERRMLYWLMAALVRQAGTRLQADACSADLLEARRQCRAAAAARADAAARKRQRSGARRPVAVRPPHRRVLMIILWGICKSRCWAGDRVPVLLFMIRKYLRSGCKLIMEEGLRLVRYQVPLALAF